MMKKNFLILTFLIFNFHSFGQYEEQNNEIDTTFSCINNCMTGCLSPVSINIIEKFINHQIYLIDKRDSLSFVASFDIQFNFANNFKDKLIALPQLQGRWGIFTSSIRVNYLSDFEKIDEADYFNIDFQLLGLNFMPKDTIHFSVGTGFLYDQLNENMFLAYFVENIIEFPEYNFLTQLKAEYVYDYSVDKEVFKEINFSLAYHLLNQKEKEIYLTIGGIYQDFNNQFDLFTFQAGIRFNFH